MGIISKAQALEILKPHLPLLQESVEVAWGKWKGEGPKLFMMPNPRLRANAVNNLIEQEVRLRFGAASDVRIVERGQRFLLGVKGRLLLRFKKVDAEFRTRTYPTRTACAFDAQGKLAIFEEHADLPRVTLGYQLNRLATHINEVALVFAVGSEVRWHEPLLHVGPVQQLLVPPTQAAPAANASRPRRVIIKQPRPAQESEGGET